MSSIKGYIEKGKISEVEWVSSREQIADVLTDGWSEGNIRNYLLEINESGKEWEGKGREKDV